MKRTIPCSVGILTFNSDRTLGRALESIKEFNDIIICDGGSTDDTLAIAREYGARVIPQSQACQRPDGTIKDFACAKNQLIDAARHPYILILDSDEAASPELVQELVHIAQEGEEDGYRIPIRMWWREHVIEYAANYPGYQYRILRTDRGIRMVKPVHEKPEFLKPLNLEKTTLDTPWHVYLEHDFVYHYMERNRKYAERELQSLGSISFRHWLVRVVPSNIRYVISIALKTCWYHVRHPGSTHMPLRVELGRIRYHCYLLVHALRQVCRI